MSAPVVVELDAVPSVILTLPVKVAPLKRAYKDKSIPEIVAPLLSVRVWLSPMVRPALAVIKPVNVDVSVTDKLPPTFIFPPIPTPPDTIKAPVVLSEDTVLSVTLTIPVKLGVFKGAYEAKFIPVIVTPVTSNVFPLGMVTPPFAVSNSVNVDVPLTDTLPPTFIFPPIPTPPDTIKAPVVLSEDTVLSVTLTTPVKLGVFKGAYEAKFMPVIVTPVTSNVFPLGMVTPPFAVIKPVNVDVPLTDTLPPTFIFPPIPAPPTTWSAPEVVFIEADPPLAINV